MSELPLNAPFPLRNSAIWSGFRESRVLPIVFGRARVRPLQYNTDGTVYHLSDRSAQGVDAVTLNGETYQGVWEMVNDTDERGHACAFLKLGKSLDPNDVGTLSVDMRGVINPKTGELLTSPADWLWYILTNVCGRNVSYGRLADFRSACDERALEIHGVLNGQGTIFQIITQTIEPLGIRWSEQFPGLARIWPVPESELEVEPIAATIGDGLTADLNSDGHETEIDGNALRTEVRVRYGYDWADNDYNGAVTYGLIDNETEIVQPLLEIDAPFVKSAREAGQIARRMLQHRGRAVAKTTTRASTGSDIPPGTVILDAYNGTPSAGRSVVLESDIDPITTTVELRYERAVGAVPRIELLSAANRFGRYGLQTFFNLEDDVLTITARDPDGGLLVGATVVVNNVTKLTNVNGQAKFQGGPGTYQIVVSFPGYDDQETILVL